MRLLPLLAMLPLIACSGHSDASDATPVAGEPAAAEGTGTSRSYAAAGFDQIDVRGSDDVDVRVGSDFAIRATGPADLLDKLEVVKDGTTLKIGRKGNGIAWGGDNGREVKVMVMMPTIRGASISGSGDLAIDRVEADDFGASTSGSGDMTIGRLAAKAAHFSIAGSGTITASGTADRAEMQVSGSGDIDAEGLTTSRAHVSVTGSGDVSTTVNGPVDVSVMGSGDVEIGGDPTCTVSRTGSGEVRCR